MLKITSRLSKNQFFQELSREAFGAGDLEVFVDSLPIYLNTEVAFKIFLHQTKTYPRNIVWLTSSPSILKFLETLDITIEPIGIFHEETIVGQPQVSQSPNLPTDFSGFSSFNKPQPKVAEFKNSSKNTPTFQTQPEESQSIKNSKDLFEEELSHSSSSNSQKLIQSEDLVTSSGYNPSSLILANYNPYREQEYKQGEGQYAQPKNSQNQETDSFGVAHDDVFSPKNGFVNNSNSLNNLNFKTEIPLQKEKKDQFESKIYGQDIDSFDDWLTKVEQAKKSLENLKKKPNPTLSKPRIKVFSPKTFGLYKKMRIPKAATALLMVSLIFFGMSFAFATFPSQVYTLELREEEGRNQIELYFPIEDVKVRNARFLAEGSVATSGIPEKPKDIDLSQGRVRLTNSSPREVQLTNGRFYLDAPNGLRYRPRYNNSLDEVILIPGGGGTIEVDIFSIFRSVGYEQNKGTTFLIRNNNLNGLGKGLTGKSITPISLPEIKSDKYFTNSDKNRLISNINQDLASQREEELKKISGGDILSHVDWYRNIDRDDNFSHKLEEETETVKLNSDLESNIYYLFVEQIHQKIKNSNSEIAVVSDVQILDYSADFGEDGFLNITASYKFSNNKEIDSKEIQERFSNQDFASVQDELKDEYPNIIKIQKTESGMRIPGIRPRVDVAIVDADTNSEN